MEWKSQPVLAWLVISGDLRSEDVSLIGGTYLLCHEEVWACTQVCLTVLGVQLAPTAPWSRMVRPTLSLSYELETVNNSWGSWSSRSPEGSLYMLEGMDEAPSWKSMPERNIVKGKIHIFWRTRACSCNECNSWVCGMAFSLQNLWIKKFPYKHTCLILKMLVIK